MKAEEKAIQLITLFKAEQPKYTNEDDDDFEEEKRELYFAKRCSLLCVEVIIEEITIHNGETDYKRFNYWKNVKKEIEKL